MPLVALIGALEKRVRGVDLPFQFKFEKIEIFILRLNFFFGGGGWFSSTNS